MRQAAEKAQREHGMLQALAHTDPLTGLLNRRGLDAALATALHAARPGQPTAVFLLDLDGFKAINDDLGHEVGDALLVAVGARLRSQVRAGDAVARPGGDEFVVVVPMLPGNEEAARLGLKLLDCIAAPFSVAGHECRVGVTAGYVVAPFDGLDAASLLRRADAAMYAGKQAGRNCLQRGSAALELARRPGPREPAREPQRAPQ
jgi:diguanylate cyclase (GGDEF)-like protein